MASTRASAPRYFRALQHANFRRYAGAGLVSVTGTWMQVVAQNWLVLELTGRTTAVGVMGALQALPSVLFGFAGGVLADRFVKQRVLVVTQALLGLLALTLGIAVIMNMVTV